MFKYILIFACITMLYSDTKTMSWSEDYKLSWADFKGKPSYNTKAAAVTAAGLSFKYSVNKRDNQIVGFKVDISADFYPEHSWCKKESVTDHILAHEQLHFDITELHARYFRAQVQQLKPSNTIVKELQMLHDAINKTLEITQLKYDDESNFSIDKKRQLFWSNYVASALKNQSAFKTP
ncbi:hypothetical protein ES676_00610 [Bizionia saleffrena]|uniref:DUF922 domain-containing protein n=1 Tax=Bizionia saleffrena TaxID=291189 RepID=A0A8H2LHG5_9FLAO|nr:DUF922 domain-containing protein [Bizionia saleffrena]TYB80203.1 hypothetical protein ES676_00610 [Bizionia saleffrena]